MLQLEVPLHEKALLRSHSMLAHKEHCRLNGYPSLEEKFRKSGVARVSGVSGFGVVLFKKDEKILTLVFPRRCALSRRAFGGLYKGGPGLRL